MYELAKNYYTEDDGSIRCHIGNIVWSCVVEGTRDCFAQYILIFYCTLTSANNNSSLTLPIKLRNDLLHSFFFFTFIHNNNKYSIRFCLFFSLTIFITPRWIDRSIDGFFSSVVRPYHILRLPIRSCILLCIATSSHQCVCECVSVLCECVLDPIWLEISWLFDIFCFYHSIFSSPFHPQT